MEEPVEPQRRTLQPFQARSRLKHQKLKTSFVGYIVVLAFLAVLQFIGVYFFTLGFLLSRQVLPDIATCGAGSNGQNNLENVVADGFERGLDNCPPKRFSKMVVVVIDALRFDFVIPVLENEKEGANPFYHNQLPILYDLARAYPENAVLLKFLADPPTTTLQRLKGLTTGSLPTFIDAGSNFNGDAIDEDNWILQLHRHNRTVAFVGDDTWTALFNQYLDPELNYPYDSLHVWDLHTVDNGVIEHMLPLLDNSSKFDVLVGHLLGVDHAGHRYGPNHHAMRDKLQQMNTFIGDVIEKLDDDTLLVVMGDHGMDKTGNHGGESPDELESTLFLYSKSDSAGFAPKSVDNYDTSALGKEYRAVNQIDLVPTVSLLLGLPIPFNNLGFPIDEAFGTIRSRVQAAYLTTQQLMRYRNHSAEVQGNDEIVLQYHALMTKIADFKDLNSEDTAAFLTAAAEFQAYFLDYCKGLWAKFDLVLMSLGIAVLILSLTVLVTYSRSIPSVRVLTLSFEFIGSFIAMSLLGLVSSLSIYVVLRPPAVSLKTCLFTGCAAGITIGFWAPIMDRFSVLWLWHLICDFFVYNLNFFSSMGLFFMFLHCLIFASNSFVVWEDKLVLWYVSTVGISCLVAAAFCSKPRAQRILGVAHALTFVVLSRVVSMINLCREEQGEVCIPTFKTTWWSILLLFAAAGLVPKIIKSFYNLSASYHSAAPLWIETGMTFLMAMNAGYWALEYVENDAAWQQYVRGWLSVEILKSFKLATARIVLFIALVLANFSWSRGPLCVKIDFSQAPKASSSNEMAEQVGQVEQIEPTSQSTPTQSQPIPTSTPEQAQSQMPPSADRPPAVILGYENVYGSSYFLLVINITVAVLLVTKPLGAVSICILLVQILSLLELFDLLELRRNLVAPVTFGLLGYQHFFSTGHQATLSSIQWEVGFMTTQTIVFPLTHLNIVLNTFGAFLIVCVAVPLVTLWRLPPSAKPITVLSQIVTNVTTLMTYQTLTSIMSFIFVAHFRRHLMVWKVFAPRFMLSALLLIIFNLTLTVVTMWFATRRLLTQVNRIFGK